MENQRIDIKVLTLLSLSSFLAPGVLFNLCSSSITSFSTVSIEFSSFLCGVRHSESSEVL
uniref:Polychome, UV-B-insensitive 4 n=1 Tax=Solanum tuberosum TaxID=4113 RepID=M1C6S4_SOLTU